MHHLHTRFAASHAAAARPLFAFVRARLFCGTSLAALLISDAGARFSSCVTLTPCTLAVVDVQRLDEMITHEPRLGVALLASLSRRLSLRLRQVSARLSALLSQN